MQFPGEERICFRTSNIIERVNKGFKRRTKPIEIVTGEILLYASGLHIPENGIDLGIKTHRKNAINLPFIGKLAENYFTQYVLTVSLYNYALRVKY